ncbi:MAG TPA: hypothetical protein VK909_20920 [Anaerolineales bacterium]|nr:hypothetical protein [Anaerolineales bacterium]
MLRRIALIVLALGMALSLSVTPAAAKTETFHFSFKGQFAEAFFSTFDETGCVETFVYVAGQEGKVKQDGKPAADSTVVVNILQFNHCTGEYLLDAFGFDTLAPDDFVIDKKINQATLATTVLVGDFVSGASFPVDIHVSWTGVGETSTVKDREKVNEPGFKLTTVLWGPSDKQKQAGR